jgi:hypothetical protein
VGENSVTTVDPASHADERQVRLTEREALANVRTVLELCAAGELRCSDKTNRPTAATIRTVDAHLVHGDFYADERIATVAWPLLVQAGGLAKLDGAAGSERACRTGETTRRDHPPLVASLAHPRRNRRVQPDRADHGAARPQCTYRGQARRQTVAVALAAVAVALHLADSTSVDCPAQALRLYS